MKIAYLDCFSGISGDMILGALLDAGLGLSRLRDELSKIRVKGYRLSRKRVMRGPISGIKFDCIADHHASHSHRSLRDIEKIISGSRLSSKIKTSALEIFGVMARAESKVHGRLSSRTVALHEVGDIDSIIDVVGSVIGFDALGIDEIYSSAISMGSTIIQTRHGTLPIPAPAAMEILRATPIKMIPVPAELATPTGAAIVKVLAKGRGLPPLMTICDIGYGAGSKVLADIPNMLRIVIGEKGSPLSDDRATVIEANIDDMNPQIYSYLFDRLLAQGALDVYATPIIMKKSRPATKITVIAERERVRMLADTLFRESTSIGIRYYDVERIKLDRKMRLVKTPLGSIRVKVSSAGGCPLTISPEYDDCVRVATAREVPLKQVYDLAVRAARIYKEV